MIENIKERFGGEERAVSPVIGVILMVAITVILAAVIGTFVLGLTDEVNQTAPQASFSIDEVDTDQNNVTVRHEGGDTIEVSETTFVIENSSETIRFAASDHAGGASDSPLSTTDRIEFDFDGAGNVTLKKVNDGDIGSDTPSTFQTVDGDDRITITIIDESSGEIIWEREFRA